MSKDRPYFGLFMEQGTGKTFVSLATLQHLHSSMHLRRCLILAPNGVHDNWATNEFPAHSHFVPGETMELAVWHSSDGVKAKQRFQYLATHPQDKLVVLVANIEAVRTTDFVKIASKFLSGGTSMIICDESTAIKNPKALQAKAAVKLAQLATYRRILTGTPMTQGPLDVWMQCQFLDKGALPWISWTAFKAEFAVEEEVNLGPSRPRFMKLLGYKNTENLAEHLSKFCLRVMKEDCLDLPDKIYQTRYVEMTDDQKRIYKEVLKTCMAQINETSIVTAQNALELILRLHQVALGYVKVEDGSIQAVPSNRLRALDQHLDENSSRGIIFCRFKEDVRKVGELLAARNLKWAGYSGEQTAAVREDNVGEFQDRQLDFLVATSAAARGLTLTSAEQVIYYSQDYRLEIREQSEDRAHRIGQTKHVVYTDIVTRGSVDEKIVTALRNKKDLVRSVLDQKSLLDVIAS